MHSTAGVPPGRVPARVTRSRLVRGLGLCAVVGLHVPPLLAVARGTVHAGHLGLCAVMYAANALIFGVALHRYFAHRAFRTSRGVQFLMAIAGCTVLTDPIGFAGKHRIHHRQTDGPGDVHGPHFGLYHCWIGHLLDDGYPAARLRALAADLTRFPELRFLHRHFWLPPAALALTCLAAGGFPAFAIGFCLSRVLGLHMASAVNYFGHLTGYRNFETRDRSHNLPWLGVASLGEGWHNNHHRYPSSARCGLRGFELDACHAVICCLERLGLITQVKRAPWYGSTQAGGERASTRPNPPKTRARMPPGLPMCPNSRVPK